MSLQRRRGGDGDEGSERDVGAGGRRETYQDRYFTVFSMSASLHFRAALLARRSAGRS